MDLTQLANLGEFIGGVAVVGSLLYVGLQLQQTRKVLVSNAHRDWVRDNTTAIHFAAADDSAANIWLSGLANYRELDPVQSWRFDVSLTAWLTNAVGAFQDRSQGLGRMEAAESHEMTVKQMLCTPGGRDWWGIRKGWFSPSFQGWVDRLLRDDALNPNPPLSGLDQ